MVPDSKSAINTVRVDIHHDWLHGHHRCKHDEGGMKGKMITALAWATCAGLTYLISLMKPLELVSENHDVDHSAEPTDRWG